MDIKIYGFLNLGIPQLKLGLNLGFAGELLWIKSFFDYYINWIFRCQGTRQLAEVMMLSTSWGASTSGGARELGSVSRGSIFPGWQRRCCKQLCLWSLDNWKINCLFLRGSIVLTLFLILIVNDTPSNEIVIYKLLCYSSRYLACWANVLYTFYLGTCSYRAIIKKQPSRNINVQKFLLYVFGVFFNIVAILVRFGCRHEQVIG
ncbi:hypothetical protein POM88_046461 [Heracleum sosnowskyi]|uniref:Uncharacterized protein n=1 Tax=Heracleum sosnowskyi TaxID=360622 RepID=A0AAD8H6A3_9APIA|nr:hypothetical protein POM88_046461 [Heracleum sosnowskyi]